MRFLNKISCDSCKEEITDAQGMEFNKFIQIAYDLGWKSHHYSGGGREDSCPSCSITGGESPGKSRLQGCIKTK